MFAGLNEVQLENCVVPPQSERGVVVGGEIRIRTNFTGRSLMVGGADAL